jgi:hypothetical protein
MIREFVYIIYDQKKSNVNIVVIQINQVKFAHPLVMMISILSGTFSKHDSFFIINLNVFSGSEDSWVYIWKTDPSSNISPASSANNAKLTKKQRHHFDRAYERIRGKTKFLFF